MSAVSLRIFTTTVILLSLLKSCCNQTTDESKYVNQTYNGSIGSNDVSDRDVVTPASYPMTNVSLDYDNNEQTGRIPLYIGAFFPFGGGWDGSGIIAAVEMALDHINERKDILKGYELRMIYNDTQCQAGLGTRVLFDQLFKKPTKIMLFGGGCSVSTQAMAGTSYHWNLVTMSYSASSPALSNREAYPYFYRVVMPDTGFNPARIQIIQQFDWKRVATLHQNQEIFSLPIDNLRTLLKETNITLVTSESFTDNPQNQVENIKLHDAKIIVTNMFQNMARKVFCEAYKNQMIGEGYAWLIMGWYSVGWYLEEDPTIECTIDEMKKAVEGSFYIGFESQHTGTSEEPTISGLTPIEFEEELRSRLELPENQHFKWHNRNPYGYDAMWAVALVLNQSTEILKTKTSADNKTKLLENFTYDDEEIPLIFLNILKNMSFSGISGLVSFVDGDRIDVVRIEQLRASCEDSWYHYKQNCYSFSTNPLSFYLAQNECSHRNGNLVSITSEEQYYFLLDIWKQSQHHLASKWYVGLVWDGEKLAWVNQQVVHNASWFTTQGDIRTDHGVNHQFCVAVDFTTDGNLWIATNCSEELPYICEKSEVFFERQIASYIPNIHNPIEGQILWYENISWPGDKVPLDHTPEIVITIVMIHNGISWYLYLAMSLLAGMGIILTLFFLVFNIHYKNQKVVRMSSPNLNNLILVGGISIYSSIFFAGMDSNLVSPNMEEFACQIRVWLFSAGFVVAFGAMFSKTWRVHKIAAFKKPKRTIITDNQLFMMVFSLFMVDVLILTAWQIFDPMNVIVTSLLERDDPDVANQRLIPYIKTCSSDLMVYWLVPLYGYKGLLLIFGAFLAWETRKVTIPALNDSKLIGICVYNVIILCIIGMSVSFIISDDPSALYLFTSCIVVFCASLTLLIVFVPKIISVVKYPEGEPISTMKRNATMTTNTLDANMSILLIKENRELKEKLEKVKSELNHLKQKCCGTSGVSTTCIQCVCANEPKMPNMDEEPKPIKEESTN